MHSTGKEAKLTIPPQNRAACFGGPMLNILLGIGIGGAWMTITSAKQQHAHHPNKPMTYKPYHIQVGGTLIISAVTVLITLVVLLIAVPMNRWVMSRRIGWGLIAIWTVSTTFNLVVELLGLWEDIS
jgi:sodium/potassium/calcium exchanger 6